MTNYHLREKGKVMIIRNTLITAIAFIMLHFANANGIHAQDEVIELKPVEITGTRSLLTTEDTPSSVTVITAEEIEQKQHQTVIDILRGELGVDITASGPTGSLSSVFMRGTASRSTLVMIDGVQVNSNTTGAFNFADLMTDNIERIEILRGPQSINWGADAVGGVINIVTKRGKGKPSHSFGFEGGSFATFKETASSSGSGDRWDYSVSASRTDSEGFSAVSELRGATEDDGYGNTTLSGRMGYDYSEDGRVEFIGRYAHANFEFDNAFGKADNGNFSNSEEFNFSLPIQNSFGGWWDVKFTPSIYYLDSFAEFSGSHSKIFTRNYTFDLQNNLKLGEYYSLVFGGEYQILNANSVGSFKKDTYTQGYFLQALFNYEDRVVLTGGFRHDINSSFEDKTTYKFEAAYRFKKTGTRLRAVYATGFQAPTFNFLFFPSFSNPNLKPEEVKSWEVGFDQDFLASRVRLSVTYFDADYTNLIESPAPSFLPQNVAKATSRGIESKLNIGLIENLDLTFQYTLNEAEDESGAQLIRRAKNKFSASLHHSWRNKLDTTVGVFARGSESEGTDAFTTVRAALTYKYNDRLKFTVRGENLLDEEYEEISTFGTPRISGYAGFVYNF